MVQIQFSAFIIIIIIIIMFVFYYFISSFLSQMEFWFLATVAFGLFSWEHIFGNIVDLIAQTVFEEN